MRFDLLSLKLFVAVCESKSISRAATREHIAASAVSKRISDLEELVKAPLFHRTTKGLEPTASAQALLHHARILMRDLQQMEYELTDHATGVSGRVRIHAPALTPPQLRDLAESGVRIDGKPVPLRDVLASARLVVHSGGSGVAGEALAAGIPQLVLSCQIEQTLNGQALQQAGVGRLIETYDSSAHVSSDVIAALCDDDALAARAAEAGSRHRQYLSDENPALKCERACLGLLGIDAAGGALT